MTYVHISSSKGMTIENFRAVSARHNPPQDVDGLLAWAAGSDENSLHVVTMWESRAHMERFAGRAAVPRVPGLRDGRGRAAQHRVHRVRGRRAVHPLSG